MSDERPIGVFDSGIGGLTVVKALRDLLPNESIAYLGDTARVPYGTKSLATVERYAVENAKFLAAHGIKLLVVACNTASTLVLPQLRARFTVPFVGTVPAIKPACARSVMTAPSVENRARYRSFSN